MKRSMLSLVTLTMMAAAALPAAAHTPAQNDGSGRAEASPLHGQQRDHRHTMFSEDFDRLHARVDRSARNRGLTPQEARNLAQQIDYVARVEQTYMRTDGRMTQWERQDMLRRIDRLKRLIVRFENDDDGRGAPRQH